MQHTTKNIGVKIEARSLQFENFCLMTVELIYYYFFFFPLLWKVFLSNTKPWQTTVLVVSVANYAVGLQ